MKNAPIIIEKRAKQLLWLASLRGIAAFFVFFSHSGLIQFLPKETGFITGRIGVSIFFLITGYLTINSRLTRSKSQYITNRFIRMYPIYWVLLSISFIIYDIPLKKFMFNLTLFQEYFGVPNIIGSSWMMSIQIAFFVFIAFSGVNFFFSNKSRPLLIFLIVIICAIITGFVRYKSGLPFPTAFFLLNATSLIGMYYYDFLTFKNISKTNLIAIIIIFEAGLMISAKLSYGSRMPAYMVAYNIGLLLFWIARRFNLFFHSAIFLGKISYTFFLGAGIGWYFFTKIVNLNFSEINAIIIFILQFLVNVVFSWMMTKFIEQPLFSHFKK